MPRILLILVAAVSAFAFAAAPAFSAPPPAAHTATDDACDPDVDVCDDWSDEGEECAPDDEACEDAWDECWAEDDWDDEDWSDDPGDDWSDEDPSGDPGSGGDQDEPFARTSLDEDDPCETGLAEDEPAPKLSGLKATPPRGAGGRVQLRFKLTRGDRIRVAISSLAAGAAHRCGKARASRRAPARRCTAKPAGRTLVVRGRAGLNTTVLRGWKGQAGSAYRLTATPATAGAKGATTTFRLPTARGGQRHRG